jgi:DNA-binding CsgD family transcriptional regulator
VPDTAAHVRAAGLLVPAGRGDPGVGPALARVRELAARPEGRVLLVLATASVELEVATWAGDAAAAVAAATGAARVLEQLWGADRLGVLRLAATALGPVADAAAAARLTGDDAAAQRWTAAGGELVELARAAVRAHEEAIGPIGREGRAWAARLDAEEARLQGRAAPELWQAAVDAFGAASVPEAARSRRRLAEALLLTDDRAGAAEELRAAHEVAVALGARPLQEALLALARRGRLDTGLPGARAVDPAAVLTAREAEVLALLAEGRTNRQIGTALFVSEKTASVHVSNILRKLGVGGRTEAVAVAAQRGLLPEPARTGRG